MSRLRHILWLGCIVAVALTGPSACAGVVVLSNGTSAAVHFVVAGPDGRETSHDLRPGRVIPLTTDGDLTITFGDNQTPHREQLRPNAIYRFTAEQSHLRLSVQPLPGMPANTPASQSASAPTPPAICIIPVKIVVDDKEPTVQRIWEKRYRQRLAEASQIIERHCPVRFDVVAVGHWNSNGTADSMEKLIHEFEREVAPSPARLVIGFTGQYHTLRDDKHMGGTRGPFCPHILIREYGRQLADPERLEILTHELGHYLGAVHSADPQSVMRPDIGDRQSRAKSFQIGFDAENTLAMYLIGEDSRGRPLQSLGQLSLATRTELRSIYRAMAVALPNDPAAPGYLALLDRGRTVPSVPRSATNHGGNR